LDPRPAPRARRHRLRGRGSRHRPARLVPRPRHGGTRQTRRSRRRRPPERDIRERDRTHHCDLCAVARSDGSRQGIAHRLGRREPSVGPRVEHARGGREVQGAALLPGGVRDSDHDARRRGHRSRDARLVRALHGHPLRRGPRRNEPGHRRDPAPRLRIRPVLLPADASGHLQSGHRGLGETALGKTVCAERPRRIDRPGRRRERDPGRFPGDLRGCASA